MIDNIKGKQILITSTDVMMIQFLVPHVLYLLDNGANVDVACSKAEGYQNEGYKEKIKEIYLENPTSYENLLIAIKNLPPHFNNTRENIIEKLEQYLERENSLSAYDNERF